MALGALQLAAHVAGVGHHILLLPIHHVHADLREARSLHGLVYDLIVKTKVAVLQGLAAVARDNAGLDVVVHVQPLHQVVVRHGRLVVQLHGATENQVATGALQPVAIAVKSDVAVGRLNDAPGG